MTPGTDPRTTRQLVLVLGAAGQLGAAMAETLGHFHEVVPQMRADLDITSADAVRETIAHICPDVIINCAAYNKVDAAETDPLPALATNAWAVRSIARAAADIDAVFVHFSTDFVFDGTTDRPYTETDPPNPRGTYAASKLLGEWFATGAPRHYVIRVESLFGGRMTSSVDHLLNGIRAGESVRAFADRTVSPSFVEDVVEATRALVDGRGPYGLYHCVNTGWTTWLDVAQELARLAGKSDAVIEAVEMASSHLKAARPKFAALSNAKLESVGITMPTWQDALQRYVSGGDARSSHDMRSPHDTRSPHQSRSPQELRGPDESRSHHESRGPEPSQKAREWHSPAGATKPLSPAEWRAARPKKPRGPGRAKKAKPPEGYELSPCAMSATRSAIARHDVHPGESIPAA
jgi:dTDP-4-dehydrorhamnose reductase